MKKILMFIKKILGSWVLGLPLLYLGVLTLAVHYLLHSTDLWAVPFCQSPCNWLLVVAILLEILGAMAHFCKIKHANR